MLRTILVSDRGNPTEEEKKNHENGGNFPGVV